MEERTLNSQGSGLATNPSGLSRKRFKGLDVALIDGILETRSIPSPRINAMDNTLIAGLISIACYATRDKTCSKPDGRGTTSLPKASTGRKGPSKTTRSPTNPKL